MITHLPHFHEERFVLFELIRLLKFNSLLSKSALFMKLAISFLLAKFAYFNVAVKLSAVI